MSAMRGYEAEMNFSDGPSTLPLTFTQPGQEAIVREIHGGRELRARLRDLGLNPGAKLRVMKNDAGGPLIVAVKEDSRIALGRGMAHRILIELIDGSPDFQITL